MTRKIIVIIVSVALASLLAACSPPQSGLTESSDMQVVDYVSMVEALRAAGATVEPSGEVNQPFFSVPGQIIEVNGDTVQVFEYESIDVREEEAATISDNGSAIGTTMVTWIEPPTFWAKGRLIVIAIGGSDNNHQLLAEILGEPLVAPSAQ